MDYLEIPLTQGKVALVSPADFPALSKFKWHAVRCGSGEKFYAKRARTFMHRSLLAESLMPGLVVDHINGNSLDNRRENIRVVTLSENSRNLWAFNGASGFRGVFPQRGSYVARIGSDYLGCFETAIEAAHAVNQKLNALDGAIGARNQIDCEKLLSILMGRRALLDAQIEQIRGNRA